jgi:hypothetical protein
MAHNPLRVIIVSLHNRTKCELKRQKAVRECAAERTFAPL